jgi:6-phosphofructokinase 2
LTQIMTVTPNPAIDVSTSIGKLLPFSKLRCAPVRRDPGGGGINVARVVNRLGGEAAAVFPAGGATGRLLAHLVEREGVRSFPVSTVEETREDFTVFEETTGQQYRFVMPGAPLSTPEWVACLDRIATSAPRPDYVIGSGSLPPQVPEDFFGRVARIAKEIGARMIVDTSGPALTAALTAGVYLIKPNLREFQELTGTQSADEVALVEAGRRLISRDKVEIIALTLGPAGALVIARAGAFRAEGLPIKPVSVVGAGDSFLGAMIWRLARQDSLDNALRYAVAAGSAALMRPGTELCSFDGLQSLLPQVTIRAA